MSKLALLDVIIARLTDEVEQMTRAALATHAEATDEENKAEDKYDTRGLEASYLAHGQSKAAEEAAQALAQFQALPRRDLTAADPIVVGALVTLQTAGQPAFYFIGPRAGGTEIELNGRSILIITPQSPLGRQLMGRRQGDKLQLELGGRRTEALIAAVA
jgi:transcription elongation GreA/GreB family factor